MYSPPERQNDIPLTSLDSVFGEFVENCKAAQLTKDDYALANDIRSEMCQFCDNESQRRKKLCDIFRSFDIPLQPGPIGGTGRSTDGHIQTGDSLNLVVEIKNEYIGIHADPTIQPLFYYVTFCEQYRMWENESGVQPCFVIFIVGTFPPFLWLSIASESEIGPSIGFGGCALTDRATLEIFSLLMLAFHASNDEAFDALARHLSALKTGLLTLDSHYTGRVRPSLYPNPSATLKRRHNGPVQPEVKPLRNVSRIFPYPTTFSPYGSDVKGKRTSFTYRTDMANNPLLFNGETEAGPICIKFIPDMARMYTFGVPSEVTPQNC
jgi:hypothetical protein